MDQSYIYPFFFIHSHTQFSTLCLHSYVNIILRTAGLILYALIVASKAISVTVADVYTLKPNSIRCRLHFSIKCDNCILCCPQLSCSLCALFFSPRWIAVLTYFALHSSSLFVFLLHYPSFAPVSSLFLSPLSVSLSLRIMLAYSFSFSLFSEFSASQLLWAFGDKQRLSRGQKCIWVCAVGFRDIIFPRLLCMSPLSAVRCLYLVSLHPDCVFSLTCLRISLLFLLLFHYLRNDFELSYEKKYFISVPFVYSFYTKKQVYFQSAFHVLPLKRQFNYAIDSYTQTYTHCMYM